MQDQLRRKELYCFGVREAGERCRYLFTENLDSLTTLGHMPSLGFKKVGVLEAWAWLL